PAIPACDGRQNLVMSVTDTGYAALGDEIRARRKKGPLDRSEPAEVPYIKGRRSRRSRILRGTEKAAGE
ncbi:hypothetical protein, partial [Streptomyces sp. SID5471]|uniref:hypothetical protein n=1 Tax=Streptomyces sp. SID5471 TaxID=2690298 RepID=UPI001F25182A